MFSIIILCDYLPRIKRLLINEEYRPFTCQERMSNNWWWKEQGNNVQYMINKGKGK